MTASSDQPPSEVEGVKLKSRLLRGTLQQSLADPRTAAIAEADTHVSKFHGIYQQDDRDLRNERARQKLEPAYEFMIRIRVPAGLCTTDQWLSVARLAREYANGTVRLTTRQAIQLHGVLKGDLKATIQGINATLLDTLAACGDVNRNVTCTPLAASAAVQRRAAHWAAAISAHLTPRTRAYHEIWLDGEKVAGAEDEAEPIYGPAYLPRKFKIAIAIPPSNDVDVFAQDLGLIAIERAGKLIGFNVAVGGGMGMSHGEPATYPRLADVIGFCAPSQGVSVAEAVVAIQRDFGDRSDRKHARLKYTIDDRGLDWFTAQLRERGIRLRPPAPYVFEHSGDRFGWLQDSDGRWHVTLFVPSGRVLDHDATRLQTGLAAIARAHDGGFRITPNQNLIVSDVEAAQKPVIEGLLEEHGLDLWRRTAAVRRQALACVALPTCGLAMAEAERYLPRLLTAIEDLLARHGLSDTDLSVRMTGCPNGCARPYLADVGLIGKAPERYNLRLGGGRDGARLNDLVRENLGESEILGLLDEAFDHFVRQREPKEAFSDCLRRTGWLQAAAHG